MEFRVLKYFLMVAREENITKAAALLHLTQPTLSRQLMQLEAELGVKLFHRSKHSIILTEDGMLLKRRAQEIVSLSDKTVQELSHKEDVLSGEIAIGCGETKNMLFLSEQIKKFRQKYPLVQFSIHSAIADDIKERIEKGILDIGLLMEPVDVGKYEFIRMPQKEKWGILVRKDSELAAKESINPKDLTNVPLIMVKRELVKSELASWFGDYYEGLQIAATYNLILNAASMVERGVGVVLCFDLGATFYEDLCFIPLAPTLETGSVLVWKKNQTLGSATSQFMRYLKNAF
ncbi:LysR family transcriptional regulator [Parablautia intestinalis]|uniref:LysR family transcriptional regulator n=1 Tax=Parablautia intestinalis TaxID=2320100 RepID=UPI00256EA787|nr:LysR family transcriptional regulator [Parablautia intestinalis]